MFPPKACPTPDRCELLGPAECPGRCKPRALARTPAPIPLHLAHLTPAERNSGLVRITEGLQRLLRRGAPAEASAPFLSLTQDHPAMSEHLAPPHPAPMPTTPEPPARPAAPKPGAGPTAPLQIVPVRYGGFMIANERGPIAVAVDGPGLAALLQRWAAGDIA